MSFCLAFGRVERDYFCCVKHESCRTDRCILGSLSAHSYNTLLTGELLVAVGGRGEHLRWGREQAARVLK